MSNRLTFSLASLIFLIALGLVFAPMSVMAHPDASTSTATPRPHDHPLVDDLAENTGEGGDGTAVTAHNHHPMVTSITLKKDDNIQGKVAAVAADDGDDNTDEVQTFTIVIDFDRDVTDAATSTDFSTLPTIDFSTNSDVVNVKGIVQAGTASVAAVSRVPNDNSKFEAVVTISTNFPSGTKDADDETLTFRVIVPASSVFSLQTTPAPGKTVAGGASVESMSYEFTLVKKLPDAPSTKVTIAPGTGIMATDKGMAKIGPGDSQLSFTLTPATAGKPGVTVNLNDVPATSGIDYSVTESGTAWTLAIRRSTLTNKVDVMASAGFELQHAYDGAAAAKIDKFTVDVDRMGPTVTSIVESAGVLPVEGGPFRITVNFDEALSRMPVSSDFTVTNGAITEAFVQISGMVYTAVLTPDHGVHRANTDMTKQAVELRLNAGLTDLYGNASMATAATADADGSFKPLKATSAPVVESPPGKPTGVTAMKGTGDNAGKITISWTAPTDMGTPPLTGYFVTKHYMVDGAAATKRFPATGTITATSYTIPPAGSTDTMVPPGTYTFTVTAVNTAGMMASDPSAPVTIEPTNADPSFAPNAKNAYTFTVDTEVRSILPAAMDKEDDADDADDKVLTYSIDEDNLPSGLDFDSDGRVVSGTPDTPGTTDVSYMATDSGGKMAELLITFTVNPAPGGGSVPPPAVNTAPRFADNARKDFTFTQGVAVSVILDAATDDGSGALTHSIDPNTPLPSGLTFNRASRSVSGTPNTPGTMQVRYIATDSGRPPLTAELIITFTVNAAVSTGPPVTSTDNELTGLSVPAESYVILVHPGYEGLPAHLTADQKLVWNGMPNLEKLLFSGGSVTLTRAATPQLDHDGKADTDARNAQARDLIITEVMWARNTARVGQVSEAAHQWIEIYNPLKVAVGAVTVTTKAGRPPLEADSGEVLLDRLSNVVSGGWQLAGLGQDGYDDGNPDTSSTEFISMYRKERGKDGHTKGHWAQSTEVYLANHRGTPGAKERKSGAVLTATNANRGPVIFNEISNNATAAYEWIELRNVSGGEVNLKNWEITRLTSKGANQASHNAVEMIQFPNADRKIPAGGILLVVATDPLNDDNHPLQTGWDITKGADDQRDGVNADSPRYIVLGFKGGGMPDDGNFVLVLRNRGDRTSSNGDNNTRDVAGYVPGAALKVDTGSLFTGLWPLVNFPQPNWDKNQLKAGEVHRRQFADIDGTKSKDKNQDDKTAFRNVGWTGIGYRRNAEANAQNGGTPGYPNNALKSYETVETSKDFTTPVIISEVMYGTGKRVNMPQWIELYNTSKTEGISLDGWRLRIINHDQNVGDVRFDGDLSKDYNLSGRIPPGQTFLITAYSSRNDTRLPSERIHALNSKRGGLILSQYGFEITLESKAKDNKDANRKAADRVGNLADAPTDTRIRRNAQSYVDPAWMLPMGTNEDGNRVSIVRTPSKAGGFVDGQLPGGWTRFDLSNQFVTTIEETSYGHDSDLSSPGYTIGGVLPVSLSKFRPERLATGEVVVRWATESETNNAGFNILRGEKLDGEFTKLNTKLIAGKGTTSEKNSYDFVDTSAKPNVVYYYQIQDVSLDGDVTTLRTTHLRGNISVAGKLTTTWGELKALQ